MVDYHVPTQVLYESARRDLANVIEKAKIDYALPAYLIEGLLSAQLAELRNSKCDEIAQGYSDIIRQISPEEELSQPETEQPIEVV